MNSGLNPEDISGRIDWLRDEIDALRCERDGLLLLLKEARMGLLGSGDWRLLERISAAIAASKASGGGEVTDAH